MTSNLTKINWKNYSLHKIKRHYYGYCYSDNDNELVDDERSESVDECSNEDEEVMKKYISERKLWLKQNRHQ